VTSYINNCQDCRWNLVMGNLNFRGYLIAAYSTSLARITMWRQSLTCNILTFAFIWAEKRNGVFTICNKYRTVSWKQYMTDWVWNSNVISNDLEWTFKVISVTQFLDLSNLSKFYGNVKQNHKYQICQANKFCKVLDNGLIKAWAQHKPRCL